MAGKNEVTIDVVVRERGGKKVLKDTGDGAKKTGTAFGQMGKDASLLSKKLFELDVAIRNNAKELERTGDTSLVKVIRKQQREMNALGKIRRDVLGIGGGAAGEVGKSFIQSLAGTGSELKGAMGAARGPAIAGAVALGASIAPFLGGAISSAVLGGTGAGGIIGGVALAARDSRVKAEAETLGALISSGLTTVGEPFIGPTIDSIRLLGKEFAGSSDEMREAFATIAPVLNPLTEGIGGLVRESMPGVIKAMESAKPVIRAIGNELPELGRSFSDFFDTVSEDPDGAIMAIKALSQATSTALDVTGNLVAGLSQAFETTQRWGVGAADTVGDVAEKLQYVAPIWSLVARGAREAQENYQGQLDALNRSNDATRDHRNVTESLTTSYHRLGSALTAATGDIEAQRMAMLNLVSASLDVRRATVDMERAVDEMGEAAKENGTSLDITTEAGRRNVETIEAGIDALLRGSQAAYDSARANGATALEAEEAAKRYRDQWIPALEAAAVKAGFNASQVRALHDELRKLDGKTVTYTLVQKGGRTIGAKVPGGFIPAGFEERAAGGPVMPNRTYLVGERGPELLQMGGTGGHVYDTNETAAMMGGGSRSGGAQTVNFVLEVRASDFEGNSFESAIVQAIRKAVDRIGGGSVQRTFGRNDR